MVELILRKLRDLILRLGVELGCVEGSAIGRAEHHGLPFDTGLVARWHCVSWVQDRRPSVIIVTAFPNTLRLQVLRSICWSSHGFCFQGCTSLNVLVLMISEVRESVSRRQDPSSMRGVHVSLRTSSASSAVTRSHRVGLLVDPLAPPVIV